MINAIMTGRHQWPISIIDELYNTENTDKALHKDQP